MPHKFHLYLIYKKATNLQTGKAIKSPKIVLSVFQCFLILFPNANILSVLKLIISMHFLRDNSVTLYLIDILLFEEGLMSLQMFAY